MFFLQTGWQRQTPAPTGTPQQSTGETTTRWLQYRRLRRRSSPSLTRLHRRFVKSCLARSARLIKSNQIKSVIFLCEPFKSELIICFFKILMLLNFECLFLFCLSLKASEDEKDTEDPSSGAAKSKKRRKKKKKTEEEGAPESQARRRKHKALRIMNETALFLLARIHIVCTLSFISLKAAGVAPQEPPTLSSKKQQSSSISSSSSSQSELDSFWLSCILSREQADLQTPHAVLFFILFFFFSINLFAEKPEPVAEPPKPSQKKKVRRET